MQRRSESRLSVDLPGSYTARGISRAMYFSQISSKGCRVTTDEIDLHIGEAISLYLGPVGPIDGIVRWRSGDRAGIEFEAALDGAVVGYFAAFIDEAA